MTLQGGSTTVHVGLVDEYGAVRCGAVWCVGGVCADDGGETARSPVCGDVVDDQRPAVPPRQTCTTARRS